MHRNSKYQFPNPALADEEGLLAVGGDLHPERLLEAYYSGIFPWYAENQPILWWSPDPRMVLFPEKLKVSKSMRKLFRRKHFRVTFNQNFEGVMQSCADIFRPDQDGTWIMPEMIQAYTKLHQMGYGYSVEVWRNEDLVGGVYGIFLKDKKVFCGESMFSKESNASKYGLISLVEELKAKGIVLFDCQIYSEHLESLGAIEIPREQFLKYLK